ncbi:MAG: universal stress protein [Candidatus Longimicrobiales bacterium M2_2A_002]
MDTTQLREILVPLDGSGTAEWALGLAGLIGRRADARLRLVRVLSSLGHAFPDITVSGYLDEWEERQHEEEARYLAEAAGRVRGASLEVEAHTTDGDPVRSIVDAASSADLVIMTAHGWSGPERAWLGHVADGVVHHVRTPVVIVRAGGREPPGPDAPEPRLRRILVATDGSAAARAAEESAAGLARLLDARLTLFRAVQAPAGPSSPYIPHAAILDREAADERDQEARAYLAERAAQLEGLDVEQRTAPTYTVARSILDAAADAGADLLAVGTHRDSRLARIVLGSVADKVVRGARIPVLIAHAAPA